MLCGDRELKAVMPVGLQRSLAALYATGVVSEAGLRFLLSSAVVQVGVTPLS